MRRIEIALLVAALIAPATANAGLVLGFRTGISRTGGSIMQGAKTTDYAGSMVPLQLDAGWKFRGHLTLGGFFTMNLGLVSGPFKDACDASGSACSANQTRVGGQAQWNFWPARRLDPWVGASVAWEVLGIESIHGTSGVNTNFQGTGWDVQAGFDYWVRRWFSVSPYLALSAGTYDERKVVSDPLSDWEPVPGRKAHFLFTIGVRVGFDFGGAARSDDAPAAAPPGT